MIKEPVLIMTTGTVVTVAVTTSTVIDEQEEMGTSHSRETIWGLNTEHFDGEQSPDETQKPTQATGFWLLSLRRAMTGG